VGIDNADDPVQGVDRQEKSERLGEPAADPC